MDDQQWPESKAAKLALWWRETANGGLVGSASGSRVEECVRQCVCLGASMTSHTVLWFSSEFDPVPVRLKVP
jgi:hypothetical protein